MLQIRARARAGMVLASVLEVARRSSAYQPRSPAASVLYQIVRDHLESFRANAVPVCDGERRPQFIEEEFEGDRIHLTRTGRVRLDLRHRWADGTTHLLFEPLELLERLAALTRRPRINLVLYYGVLGARAAWRSRPVEEHLAEADVEVVQQKYQAWVPART